MALKLRTIRTDIFRLASAAIIHAFLEVDSTQMYTVENVD
jgi:hypothetical protein